MDDNMTRESYDKKDRNVLMKEQDMLRLEREHPFRPQTSEINSDNTVEDATGLASK